MIIKFIEGLMRWLAPPQHKPDTTLGPVPTVPSDGRLFMWIRARNGTRAPAHGVIMFDRTIGPKLDIVAEHVLMPNEYGDDIVLLSERYPCPKIKPDWDNEP